MDAFCVLILVLGIAVFVSVLVNTAVDLISDDGEEGDHNDRY